MGRTTLKFEPQKIIESRAHQRVPLPARRHLEGRVQFAWQLGADRLQLGLDVWHAHKAGQAHGEYPHVAFAERLAAERPAPNLWYGVALFTPVRSSRVLDGMPDLLWMSGGIQGYAKEHE